MSCTIYQYWGEKFNQNSFEVFYTDPDNLFKAGFDCSVLTVSLDIQDQFTTFDLTELELLSCKDLTTWLSYCGRNNNPNLLGTKLMKALYGADAFNRFTTECATFFNQLANEGQLSNITKPFAKSSAEAVIQRTKLEAGFHWLKKLYDNYYGKQYLVQIGNSSAGVCIKDRYGNVPSGNLKVESEGGLLYSSDSPSPAGGWLAKNQNSIMGLSVGPELYPFLESDYRIGAFVKYTKQENISKYDITWDIDLSSMSDEDFYLNKETKELWVKCSIDPAIYKIDDNQYVKITIGGGAPLILNRNNSDCAGVIESQGARAVMLLHGRTTYEPQLNKSFCVGKEVGTTGSSFLISNINGFQNNPPMVCPDQFCIPMKSNIFTYGPWFFQANPVGGTEVAPEKELAPWNFSSLQNSGYDTMNYFGSLIAMDGPRGLQKQENGSITVAGLPSYGIGYVIGGNAATLTDMSINISDSGYTTTYNFRTYAPKFGKPGRYLSDLWKNNYKSMSYLNKYFKDQALDIRAAINNVTKDIQRAKAQGFTQQITSTDTKVEGGNSKRSPHLMLYSGYVMKNMETTDDGGDSSYPNAPGPTPPPCDCQSPPPPPSPSPSNSSSTSGNNLKNIPIAVTEKHIENMWYQPDGFNRMAFNSLDLLFLPMSTNQQNDPYRELPRLAMYQNYDTSFSDWVNKTETSLGDGKAPNSRTRSEIPPFFFDDILQYDLPINQMYLNGVTSTVMLAYGWPSRGNGSSKGFVTNIISYGSDPNNLEFLEDADGDTRQDQENFRYNVLRGPISLQAWGYDTSGKPIPNAVDSALLAEKGQFRRRGLQDKFLKDWLANPKTWPAGPVDLRWDRERGVWVAPPANKIVVAKLLTNLEKFGVAEAELIDPEAGGIRFYEEYDLWSTYGANIKGSMNRTKIKVYDFLGVKLCKCDYVYAYYDDNRYIVLESNRAYKDPDQACCPTTTLPTQTKLTQPTPTQPTPTSCWCNLECLKTLKNFKPDKHQALVHKAEKSGADCLVWEDIVECYTTPPNFYNNP